MGLPALFSLTLFVGSTLLFVVQPIVGKMLLPFLGGSPAVWNICIVFFQALLLAGYAYAHASATWLGLRIHVPLHVALLTVPLFVLPFGISEEMVTTLPTDGSPVGWLLWVLLLVVGLPFFLVSTTAPLIQRWFAATGHPSGRDPYYLYAVSNLGSMLALLSYPLLVEPNFRLAEQSRLWSGGYVLLAALALPCAALVWRSQGSSAAASDRSGSAMGQSRPGLRDWFCWIALSCVPSSLLLGVTSYLTTDIAAIPLLWVLPLAVYLLTFILVFARRTLLPHAWMLRALPMGILLLAMVLNLGLSHPAFMPLHLLTFFLVAMVCHGELVARRPAADQLTAFYLAISIGGVVGGFFNAIVAPLIFDRVVEYPLALVLACLALPATAGGRSSAGQFWRDATAPLLIGICTLGAILTFRAYVDGRQSGVVVMVALALATIVTYSFRSRPMRFALGTGTLLLVGAAATGVGPAVHQERSFFGVLQVTYDPEGPFHRLVHGSTIHGQQNLETRLSGEPLTYYHRTGPAGQVFEAFLAGTAKPDVAIVGLGVGSLLSYAQPGQRWTVFEIDPAVVQIAYNSDYFTYVRDNRADAVDVVLGDARIRLRGAPDQGYGLIVFDAFSSDAIPIHLLTREALSLYRAKLAEGGIMAFHISNRFIDVEPVLGALAHDAGLTARVRVERELSRAERQAGKAPSKWLVMATRARDLGSLRSDDRWRAPRTGGERSVWTDDYSSVLAHFVFQLK